MKTLSLLNVTGLLDSNLSLRWTLVLLHCLWQGAAIAALVFVVLWAMRQSTSHARHAVCLAGLVLLSVCLPVTFAMISIPSPVSGAGRVSAPRDGIEAVMRTGETSSNSTPRMTLASESRPVAAHGPLSGIPSQPAETSATMSANSLEVTLPENLLDTKDRATSWLPLFAPYATAGYFSGVILMLLRLAWALSGVSRLTKNSVVVEDPRLLSIVRQRAQSLGLRTIPVLRQCERVAVPMVMGLVRPLILIPGSISTGLDPSEFEAILIHELAHLRRLDLLVNVLQRVIEALLFFHPAAWYLSQCVSRERENCCDDMVLSAGHERLQYASALIHMAEISGKLLPASKPELAALAASGAGPSQLKQRVLRLLGHSPHFGVTRGTLICVGTLCLMFVLSLYALQSSAAQVAEQPLVQPAPAAQPAAKPATATGAAEVSSSKPVANTNDLPDEQMAKRQKSVFTHQVANLLNKGDFKPVVDLFDPALRESLPATKLSELWRDMKSKYGDDPRANAHWIANFGKSELWWLELRANRAKLDLYLDLNVANKITGIWIRGAGYQDIVFGRHIQEVAAQKQALTVQVLGITGNPVEKCRVRFYHEVLSTDEQRQSDLVDADGCRWRMFLDLPANSSATATGVNPGRYRAVAWSSHSYSSPNGNSPVIVLGAEEQTRSVSVRVQPGGTVRVTSLRSEDGKPLEHPHTIMEPVNRQWPAIHPIAAKEADPFGVLGFIYEGVPPGKYKLTAIQRPSDYRDVAYETAAATMLDVKEGDDLDVPLVLKSRPLTEDEQSQIAPWIATGRVTDVDGKPLAGVEIWASAGWGSLRASKIATTDADGKYRGRFSQSGIRAVDNWEVDPLNLVSAQVGVHQAGMYEVNLNRQGGMTACYREPTANEELPEYVDRKRLFVRGQPREVNFVLAPAAEVTMQFLDENGKPLADRSVSLSGKELPPASSVIAQEKTDQSGNATFKNVPAGYAWRAEVRVERRRDVQSSPLKFEKGKRYTLVLRQGVEEQTKQERLELVFATESVVSNVRGAILVDDPSSRAPLDAAQQAAGRKILEKVREVNRYWLLGPPPEVKQYSYSFHLRDGEVQTITVANPAAGSIYERRGISYYSPLDYITANPEKVVFRAIQVGEERIELTYSLQEVAKISAGNGVAGSWAGYFSMGVREGQLVVDAKTHTPLEHRQGEFVDKYSNYSEIRPGHFVPLRIQVGKMKFDWQFKVHDPGLWLFDKLTQPLKDGKTVYISDVVVNAAEQK